MNMKCGFRNILYGIGGWPVAVAMSVAAVVSSGLRPVSAQAVSLPSKPALSFLEQADYYKFLNEDSCLYFANKAYTESVAMQDKRRQAEALTYIVDAHKTKGDYDKSLELSKTLGELAQQLDDDLLYAQSLYQIGTVYLKMGVFDAAYANLTSAIDIFRNFPPSNRLAAAYNALAVLFAKQTNFDKARGLFADGLASVDTDDKREYVLLNNNLALCYLFSDNEAAGEELLKSLIDLIEKEGIPYNQSRIQLNLCRIYIDMGRIEDVLRFGEAALAAARNRHNPLSEAQALYYIGYAHYLLHQTDSALLYFLATDSVTADAEIRMYAYTHLASIYGQAGDYRNAYEYEVRQSELKDSLNLRTNRDNLDRLTHEYQYKQQMAVLEAERRKHLLTWGASGVLTVLVLVVLWVLYSRQRLKLDNIKLKQKNMSLELERRNKEIVTQTMYLQQKNQSIAVIADRLSQSKHLFKNSNKPIIDDVIRELSLSAKDTTWEEFEMRFEQVHTDFFKNLNKRFPNLSPGEKKLCAYLKLGMNSKEIAQLTHTTVGSVEQARFRLRKKLGLNAEINLSTFIEAL
ncbi:MAG: tetratricopeptide repeat protein [Bacteroidales bacterium]|nr:tetratricopeptide repeat protein [Bacteroidales bacterium]